MILTGSGVNGYQGLFLALTLIVMIIVLLTAKDLTTAILVIGLVTNYLIISSQLTFLGDRHTKHQKKGLNGGAASAVATNPPPALFAPTGSYESFTTATTAPPGAGPPDVVSMPETHAEVSYPGSIDFGNLGDEDGGIASDEAPALGHTDWTTADRDGAPEGNPFSTNRVSAPQSASPCVDDDALAFYDGDELNTYHVRARNDPERVWAGIYRRKALVSNYISEELDERENSQWWGNHEV